ncbi:MAG: hypothetical protein TREMPRED_006069, partial [Tremellales sp. Tagirdzhanova-0007]
EWASRSSNQGHGDNFIPPLATLTDGMLRICGSPPVSPSVIQAQLNQTFVDDVSLSSDSVPSLAPDLVISPAQREPSPPLFPLPPSRAPVRVLDPNSTGRGEGGGFHTNYYSGLPSCPRLIASSDSSDRHAGFSGHAPFKALFPVSGGHALVSVWEDLVAPAVIKILDTHLEEQATCVDVVRIGYDDVSAPVVVWIG